MAFIIAAFFSFLCISSIYSHPGFPQLTWTQFFNASPFDRGEILTDNYVIFWDMNITNPNLVVTLLVQWTTGWIGFGISDNGGMKGADISIFQQQSNGQYVVNDYWSDDFVCPQLDEIQNKVLLSSSVYDGVVVLTLAIPVNSCDTAQDFDISQSFPLNVIYAYGPTQALQYHGTNARGTIQIDFYQNLTIPQFPSDAEVISLQMNPINIPSATTTYMCQFFSLPNATKYHVVEAQPIVQSNLVHHMILYACDTPLGSNQPSQCGAMSEICRNFWIGWALGAQTFYTPPEAGFPMGSGVNSVQYVLLEIHYNNPNGYSGQQDPGSGFNLTYTPTLRQYDLGTLVLGSLTFTIPPYTPSYQVTSICPGSCTSKFPYPITVVKSFLHMHLLGATIWTQQIRDNVELPHVASMPVYDFNRQNPLNTNTIIQPGDTLIHNCVYNSTNSSVSVSFGESTSDEMCFNFLIYYPLIPEVAQCFQIYNLDFALCLNDTIVESNDYSEYLAFVVDINQTTYTPLPQVTRTCQSETQSTSGVDALHWTCVLFFSSFILSLLL